MTQVTICMVARYIFDEFLHILNKILKCFISETNDHINIKFGNSNIHIYG